MKRFLLAICTVLCLTDVYAQRERTDKLDSIVVAANMTRAVKRTQISAVSLPASVMFAMPATMGEPDVLKSLQMIPGVVGAGDGNVALHIRGGSSSQNLFIVDGAVLYNPEHFKGYVSAINPVAVNDVLLYKGGFPAQYGNRLSGIVDTELIRGDFNTYHGTANVGLFAASAMVGGPIIKDKLSFMVAGRRSFYKEVTSRIVDLLYKEEPKEGMQTSKESIEVPFDNVTFYDFNAKFSYKPNNQNIIDISFYSGRDKNNIIVESQKENKTKIPNDINNDDAVSISKTAIISNTYEKWGNILTSLNWGYTNDNIAINTSLSYSRYNYDKSFNDKIENNYYYQSIKAGVNQLTGWSTEQNILEYKSDVERYQILNISRVAKGILKGIEFGMEANYINYTPYTSSSFTSLVGVIDPITHIITDKTVIKNDIILKREDKNLIYGGLFANYNFNIGRGIEIDAGIRVSIHITDGKTYIYPEPRINALYNISPKLALKASYSYMSQSEHKISTADLLEDSDIWMPSGSGIKPSTSHQIAAGLFYDFKSEKGYAVSLEGYYKTMDDILEYKEKAHKANYAGDWVNSIAIGNGWSYGIEFLAQKTNGKTKGWVSYTWSKSLEKFDREGMTLNQGDKFYAPYDCRNAVSVNVTHNLGKNFELSATFAYHTGRYRTLNNLQYYLIYQDDTNFFPSGDFTSNFIEVATTRNNVKLNDYHKLDIAINYYIYHKSGKSTICVGITNLYNNFNTSYAAYTIGLKKICLFPIMPSLSYSYSF